MVRIYVKRPIPVQATQWTGSNIGEIRSLCRSACIRDGSLVIPTLEGDHLASVDDYIIKGVKGECYPCKKDIFEETYDLQR